MTLGPFIPDPVAYAKREAIRRRQRAHGIHAVPKPEVLDRIVAEHEAAARLERSGHDELCEWGGPDWPMVTLLAAPCYCKERADAVARVARRAEVAPPTDTY